MTQVSLAGRLTDFSRALVVALLLLGSAAVATAATAPQGGRRVLSLDRIVAVVNDEVITEHELDERYGS